MIKSLVSIGQSCQSAHQLNRFALKYPDRAIFKKGPFDWLICPPESACSWLASGLEDFSEGEITSYRDHAYWKKHDFWFWHGFYNKDGETPYLDFANTVERERSKLAYQRQQFRVIDPSTTRFVFSNTQNNLSNEVFLANETDRFFLSADKYDRLRAALSQYFQTVVNLCVISRHDRIDDALLVKPFVQLLGDEPSQWKGSDTDWDKALKKLV